VAVTVLGERLAVAGLDGGIHLVDAGDPSRPFVIQTVETPGAAIDVAASDGRAYAVVDDAGLAVIDVRVRPVEFASICTPGRARALTAASGLLYIADGWSGLRVMNLRHPGPPVEVALIDQPRRSADRENCGEWESIFETPDGVEILRDCDAATELD
jgi:hypothetical protein